MGLLDWLNSPAVYLLGVDVSWAEVFGDVTGLLAVWWTARENVWNWPVGNLNSLLFLVLFVDARLYANAALQVAFLVLGFYGWWVWLRRDDTTAELERPVRRTRPGEWALILAIGVPVLLGWTWWLATRTDSPAPFWDSSVLALSLAATFGQARRLLESWWLWIAVDVVSVPLYASRGLYPTALLFTVFGVLCVVGLRGWTATYAAQRTTPPQPAEVVV